MEQERILTCTGECPEGYETGPCLCGCPEIYVEEVGADDQRNVVVEEIEICRR